MERSYEMLAERIDRKLKGIIVKYLTLLKEVQRWQLDVQSYPDYGALSRPVREVISRRWHLCRPQAVLERMDQFHRNRGGLQKLVFLDHHGDGSGADNNVERADTNVTGVAEDEATSCDVCDQSVISQDSAAAEEAPGQRGRMRKSTTHDIRKDAGRVRCAAIASSSGERCRRFAVEGEKFCRLHLAVGETASFIGDRSGPSRSAAPDRKEEVER